MLQKLARTAGRASKSRRVIQSRGIASTRPRWAASNFVMPALSPTMTEGNIASWKVKEGDSFAPGDVLLEIETDKATMDVEAQDEGLVAKITQQDGSKGIQVGQRIAVLAEAGDDLSTLKIPEEEKVSSSTGSDGNKTESKGDPQEKPQQQEAQPDKKEEKQSKPASVPGKGSVQKYPLYPSVQMLLHQHGLSKEDANKIPASGPAGRLLKGDVLAYLGQIESNYSADQSKRIADRGHLDLSNIKIAPPKAPAPAKESKNVEEVQEAEPDSEIAVPVSLAAVYELQDRIQDSLGVTLPLSTIIARASEIANERLPVAKGPPSADDMFDAVLGLDKIKRTSRGTYTPQVTALGPVLPAAPLTKAMDIIDVLAGTQRKASPVRPARKGAVGVASLEGDNLFSLVAKKGEERRARVYLERVKSILEAEPGRCVL